MSRFRTLDDLEVTGRRVLVRLDLNLPMKDGVITDDLRLLRILPTLRELATKGAKIAVLSHFGRPGGKPAPEMSLKPVALALGARLQQEIAFAPDCIGEAAQEAVARLGYGEIAVLENTRFHKGEEINDPAFAQALAKLGDLYVNDAFSCAHRAHASTEGLAHLLPAAAGRNMETELRHLNAALSEPERPVAALVGGAKISTKLEMLGHLSAQVDYLVIGGGMANTFLFAKGIEIGKSLCERDMAQTVKQIIAEAESNGCSIVLPADVVVAKALKAGAPCQVLPAAKVPADGLILDIGPESTAELHRLLQKCRTLVWNGPLGAFETAPFDAGTVTVARSAAARTREGLLLSVAGGGDTVAALNRAGVFDEFSYVSTAGGAFLEWLEGKELPGVRALQTG